MYRAALGSSSLRRIAKGLCVEAADSRLSQTPVTQLAPFEGARHPWGGWQRGLLLGVVLGLLALAFLDFKGFTIVWNFATLGIFSIVIGIKVAAVFLGQFRRFTVKASPGELARLSDESLPVYTVLVPLYREKDILKGMIAALERLDYPAGKLDIQILLEENDVETRQELARMDIPAHIRVVVVPDGRPRTKPRACNYGLERARGEYLVVFDAEDRPEPDQLKKAVAAFRKLPPRVGCLQARLNFYNGFQNLLTRWFTLEYSAWFDLYLPGLHAMRSIIPLGGTSNHFVTDVLRRAGGWDPWNVTEDCDLGVRMSLARSDIRILDSTTWEEAPCHTLPWIRQRSRWIKGYWQTLLVHTRSPLRSLARLGPWKFFMMLAAVGGQVLTLLLMPVCWAILGVWFVKRWSLFNPKESWSVLLLYATVLMALFNGYFILIHLIAGLRRRYFRLMPAGLFMPVYWLLMSLGAWFGFLQYFRAPFAWLKTPHGLFLRTARGRELAAAPAVSASRPMPGVYLTAIPFAAGMLALIAIALTIPHYVKTQKQITRATEYPSGPYLEDEKIVNASWFSYSNMAIDVSLKRGRNPQITTTSLLSSTDPLSSGMLRSMVYLKVMDGEWYQSLANECLLTSDGGMQIRAPLLAGQWTGAQSGGEWGQWNLRRVRAVGIKVFGAVDTIAEMRIRGVTPFGAATSGALQAGVVQAGERATQFKVYEAQFELGREYENPFDAKQIDLWGVIKTPSGKTLTYPAFYAQDYSRKATTASETLTPQRKPYWAIRFMPSEAGAYRWRLSGKDHTGAQLETSARTLKVAAAPGRGYLKPDKNQEYFEFENGEFFYPISLNVCWPRDSRTIRLRGFEYNNPKDGTLLYGDFFRQMSEARVTMGRIWMSPWWCGLEWRDDYPGFHGIGRYNLQNAWRLDYLIQQADKNNIMIELALNPHGPWTDRWDKNWAESPFKASNGGFLEDHPHAFTNPKSIELFKQRHRYVAARYGAFPNLFGYVLAIEVDVINEDETIRAAWHKEIGEDLRRMDGGRHLISTEFCNILPQGDPPTWKLDPISYTQAAAYTDDNFLTTLRQRAMLLKPFNKPNIIEEYGGTPGGAPLNQLALQIHNAPWIGWNIPTASTPMPWWWNFIFDWKLERYWTIFADYIQGENLSGKTWKFEELEVENAPGLRALARIGETRAYAWVYHQRITEHRYGNSEILNDSPDARLFDPVQDTAITVAGLKDGRYTVELWSTWIAGKVIKTEATVTGGKVRIPFPILSRDIAVKMYLM
ncbi:MAG: glycosyltransferase [Candidatus Sumerlaeota bacterium]|nr:glycosyltransferase [Candidatus Sumerlaeota bacterium]